MAGFAPTYADTASGQSQSVGVGLAGSTVSISAASSVTLEVIPSSNGSLGVGKASLSVSTSSDNGYRLYVSGTADPNDSNHYTSLYYDGNSSNTVDKIYGLPSTTPVSFTDTSTYGGNASSTYNHWGFAVPSDTSTTGYANASAYDAIIASGTTIDSTTIGSLTWKGISSNYTKVKENNTAGTDTFDVYFGAYVDNALMTGSYQNTIVYTAFVEGAGKATVTPTAIADGSTMTVTIDYQGEAINANQISIRLYDKTTDTTIGTCDNLSIISGTGINSLLRFTCDATKDASASYGTMYDILATISGVNGPSATLSYEADDIFRFYAPMINDAIMQDMTAESCQNASTDTTYSLVDSRTGSSYLVGKLADGNCWMLQNLYLPGGTTLSSSTSDVSSSYTLPSSSDAYSGSSTSYFSDDSTAYMYEGNHTTDAAEDTAVTTSGTATSNTGSYFSFIAATAGTGTGSSGDASSSVCPKGWKLPTSTSSGRFNTLYTAYSSNTTKFNKAFKVAFTGHCDSSNCPSASGYATYWSSTLNSSYAYFLDAYANGTYPSVSSVYKRLGRSVRCVLAS